MIRYDVVRGGSTRLRTRIVIMVERVKALFFWNTFRDDGQRIGVASGTSR